MNQYILQEDSMGCGVACVANLMSITYQQALELFEYPKYAKTVGYKCKYVVSALQRAGIDTRLSHLKQASRDDVALGELEIPSGAIVLLEKSTMFPYQHYLLKVDEGWIDPWINMHDNPDVRRAKAGIRKQLPGRPYYVIL